MTARRWVANRQIRPNGGQQTEVEFARFFAQSLDLLCIAGLDGYFKYLNPAWTARLGWTQDELKARPLLEFVHPDDREATRAEIGKLAGGAETILFENRYLHRDGSIHWLQWNARLAPASELIFATARDVTRQKHLEREILEIADREKERLGRDLHDGLCQRLAGIAALSVTLSRRLAAGSDPAAAAMAAEVGELLKETILQARDLAHGFEAVGLDEAGLEGALEVLALDIRHLFGVTCTLEYERSFPALRLEKATHLFRIAQEAVNNAVTHGKGDRIEITLRRRDGKGLLTVRDDGAGLPEQEPPSNGVGLHTMAYRARLIGGSLELSRRTPRGTAVECVFPLPGRAGVCEKADHDSEQG
ncbi:MAG TPA: PAS domain-containing sensor histidine kinase [Candidatus Polarisedimenticolia bacterium]|nr:PAS domain-containing sensor histidine kinase [Candidatus Polarisedimenticolia bacterium]